MAKERAFGTKLLMRLVGASTWDLVIYVKDIDGPSQSKDVIDVTTHDSSGSYIERLPGLLDGGTVSFDLQWGHVDASGSGGYVQAGFAVVNSLYEFAVMSPSGKVNGYASETTNLRCWRFSGILTKMGPSMPVGGSLQMGMEITVSGPVTYYPAS